MVGLDLAFMHSVNRFLPYLCTFSVQNIKFHSRSIILHQDNQYILIVSETLICCLRLYATQLHKPEVHKEGSHHQAGSRKERTGGLLQTSCS